MRNQDFLLLAAEAAVVDAVVAIMLWDYGLNNRKNLAKKCKWEILTAGTKPCLVSFVPKKYQDRTSKESKPPKHTHTYTHNFSLLASSVALAPTT